ncbi:outer membrane protein [Phenylobacterium sp.]|uniref:outer membrane protein n=1 Tax=Phenylobacterium sp. TaxID=1871053 RepID=UPI002F956408
MKTILWTTVSLATLALAGAASAQEWSGPWIGAHAGYIDRSDTDDEGVTFDTNLDGTFGDTVRTAAGADAFSPGFCGGFPVGNAAAAGCRADDESGGEFGLRLGYDWQVGPFVVGALAEVSRTQIEDSVTAFSTTPAAYTFTRELHALGAVRARGGYAFGGNLLYATGGYARGDFKRRFYTTNTANTFPVSGGDDPEGWQAGLGFDRKLTPDVTLGVEWLYTKLDDEGYVARAAGPVPATNPFVIVNGQGTDLRRTEDDFEFHSFRITTSYRF